MSTGVTTDLAFPHAQARPAELRRHHARPPVIDDCKFWVRNAVYDEDRPYVRTGNGPRLMASQCHLAITIPWLTGHSSYVVALRYNPQRASRPLQTTMNR